MRHAPRDLQPIVRRLLAGGRSQADLSRLLLWMRGNTAGHAPLIQELGDFIAHQDERDKGVFLGRATEQAYLSALSLSDTFPLTSKQFVRAIKSVAEWVPHEKIVAETGMTVGKFQAILNKGLKRLVSVDRRNLEFAPGTSYEMEESVRWISTFRGGRPAFTQDQLMDQFGEMLLRHDLAGEAEQKAIASLSNDFAVFAIHKMHLTELTPVLGQQLRLVVGTASHHSDRVAVHLQICHSDRYESWVAIFLTNLSPVEVFAPDLQPVNHGEVMMIPDYDVPLNLTPEYKLERY